MRVIEVNGKKVKIRSLTRGEIKSLKAYGYTYFGCIPTMETANDAQDKCLDIVMTDDDLVFLDTCTNKEATEVWTEILKETYGAPDEEKNSKGTSDGTPTKSD